jgi:geranylgeranylglycerol-phosphate geranylgeranyltransferase
MHYLRLIRPLNVLIIIFAGFCGVYISAGGEYFAEHPERTLILILSAALIGAAGNVINDLFDINADRINRPERSGAAGRVSRKNGYLFFLGLSLTGIMGAYYLGPVQVLIASLSWGVIYLYSYRLKGVILLGNVTVSFFTGFLFFYAASLNGNYMSALFPFLFAFLTNLIREIIKDTEDIRGDILTGTITFPYRYGIRKAVILSSILAVLLIITTVIAFTVKIYSISFTVITMILINPLLVYFIKSINLDYSLSNLRSRSRLLKLIMLLGLVAIIIGNDRL